MEKALSHFLKAFGWRLSASGLIALFVQIGRSEQRRIDFIPTDSDEWFELGGVFVVSYVLVYLIARAVDETIKSRH